MERQLRRWRADPMLVVDVPIVSQAPDDMNSPGRLFDVRDRFVALCVVVKRAEDPQGVHGESRISSAFWNSPCTAFALVARLALGRRHGADAF